MKKRVLRMMCVALLAATGCFIAQAADEGTQVLPRFSHPRAITNPYLPLGFLKQDILENKTERVERTVRPEIHKTFQIGDQRVESLAVEDREKEDGRLKEVTLDYFAQSDDGTVYYLGEDVDEYKDGKVTGHSGGWLFGRDTHRLGVLMPAHPKIGDKFRSEDVPRITREEDEVISLSETVTGPTGTHQNCLKIRESPSDGQTEYKLYAPGTGCVKEIEGHDELSLKSHETK